MTEELGKIEKPRAEEFQQGRKVYFVPLILSPGDADIDLDMRIGKYWGQVEEQLTNLQDKLGRVKYIFHEMVAASGEEGIKQIEAICRDSLKIVQNCVGTGATVQATEESDLFFEFMDWGRCLSVGLQSQQAFQTVYEAYTKSQKLRNEIIAKKIDEGLKGNETGIVFMREGHKVQFPPDIQVFYIAPPGLDELKRWLREREEEAAKAAGDVGPDNQDTTTEQQANSNSQ